MRRATFLQQSMTIAACVALMLCAGALSASDEQAKPLPKEHLAKYDRAECDRAESIGLPSNHVLEVEVPDVLELTKITGATTGKQRIGISIRPHIEGNAQLVVKAGNRKATLRSARDSTLRLRRGAPTTETYVDVETQQGVDAEPVVVRLVFFNESGNEVTMTIDREIDIDGQGMAPSSSAQAEPEPKPRAEPRIEREPSGQTVVTHFPPSPNPVALR